jgi:NTP pyrophosphatase (non-canonical NTP hydrolase)
MDKNWQTRANEFALERNLERAASVYALDVMSELGEVAKEMLLASDYGLRSPEFGLNMAAELGDLLYSICMLATSSRVDLEEAFSKTLDKYDRRWRSAGNPGSQDARSTTSKPHTG